MKPYLYIENLNSHSPLYQVKTGFQFKNKIIVVGALDSAKTRAIKKAKSEFYERLIPFYIPSEKKIPQFSIKKIEKINNNILPPFFNKSGNTSDYHCVKGKTIFTHKDVYIPAEDVYLNYPPPIYNGENKNYVDATGLSCHNSLKKSLLHGLFEVIERDQISLFWFLKNTEGILIDNSEKYLKRPINSFIKKSNYTIEIILLKELIKIGIYTTIAIVTNSKGDLCLGSSTKDNFQECANKSVLEAIMLHETMKIEEPIINTSSQSIHSVLYAYRNSEIVKKYILDKTVMVTLGKLKAIIESRADKIDFKILKKYYCYEPIYFKFRNPYNKLIVTRVIIPGALNKHSINSVIPIIYIY